MVLIVLLSGSCLMHVIAWYNPPENPSYRNFMPFHEQRISCSYGQVKCSQGGECATVCNGKSECLYKRDETACKDQCEVIPTCKKGQMFCPESGECVGICDGKKECAFGVDEKNCRKKCQFREMLCPDGKTCATPCDRHRECPGDEDESHCSMFGKCNSQRITECLCSINLLSYTSYFRCSEKISRHVHACVEAVRNEDIDELNLKPKQVCSSQSDMEQCLCSLSPDVCDFLSGPVAACIN